MNQILRVSTIACLSTMMATGCDDKGPTGPVSDTRAATTAAAKPAPTPAEIGTNEFGTKAVTSACKAFSECKNDELRGLTEGTLIMMAAFGLMGPNMEPDPVIKAIDDKMKAEKRKYLIADECSTVGNKLAEKLGFSGPILTKLVSEKRVTFDEDKATQCIASLVKGPDACSQEVKLEGELKLSQLEALEKKYDGDMDRYTKVCEEVMKGTKKEGETCEYDVECVAGSCKSDPSKKDAKVCKPKK